MNTNQVRVGVVGVGRMGQRHCRVLSNLRNTHFVGVYDAKKEIGESVAQQYSVINFDELDDLLSQVDAISIASPTPNHYEQVKHSLDKGVHVLIEKPITQSIEEATELTEIAEASGLICMVGHIERFNPAYQELKNVLEDMTVLAVDVRRLSSFSGSNQDVDVVLDLMIHDTDLVLNLIGFEPKKMDVYGLQVFSNGIDHAVAQFQVVGGPLFTMTASRVTEHKVRSIDVTAREAYIECDLLNKSILAHRQTIGEYLNHSQRGVKYRQESIVERIQVPINEPLFSELQHFVECVLNNQQPAIPARDGLNALRMVDHIRHGIYSQWKNVQN
jgi:predicted dehydrogenase